MNSFSSERVFVLPFRWNCIVICLPLASPTASYCWDVLLAYFPCSVKGWMLDLCVMLGWNCIVICLPLASPAASYCWDVLLACFPCSVKGWMLDLCVMLGLVFGDSG
ncbi:hypothetical protein BaRGS_00019737 [Batillaria attramentaria]|uniref:Uncharacterized protein n=1 Tax=Batillaria attramentaria TaxID=370345 RepID=A0ABD0KPL7_9CAEN